MLYVSRLGIAFCMEEYINPTTIKFQDICFEEFFKGNITILRGKYGPTWSQSSPQIVNGG